MTVDTSRQIQISVINNTCLTDQQIWFPGKFWPHCIRICRVFNQYINNFNEEARDDTAGLLIPISYRSWFTACFLPVTQNVQHLSHTRTVGHINDKWSNAARQFPRDFVNFQYISRTSRSVRYAWGDTPIVCMAGQAGCGGHSDASRRRSETVSQSSQVKSWVWTFVVGAELAVQSQQHRTMVHDTHSSSQHCLVQEQTSGSWAGA